MRGEAAQRRVGDSKDGCGWRRSTLNTSCRGDDGAPSGYWFRASRPLPEGEYTEWIEKENVETATPPDATAVPSAEPSATAVTAIESQHSQEAKALLADASAILTGSPTGAMVTERAQAKIRRGYA